MAGLGWQELVIILVIVMVIFGAGKLPEVAKSLGQGVKEFRSAAQSPPVSVTSSGPPLSATGVAMPEDADKRGVEATRPPMARGAIESFLLCTPHPTV
jgi:TatA/E family protein of Tat protein translocase